MYQIDLSRSSVERWRQHLPSDIRQAIPKPNDLEHEAYERTRDLTASLKHADSGIAAAETLFEHTAVKDLDRPRRLAVMAGVIAGSPPAQRDRISVKLEKAIPALDDDMKTVLAATAHRVVKDTMTPNLLETLSQSALELAPRRSLEQEATQ